MKLNVLVLSFFLLYCIAASSGALTREKRDKEVDEEAVCNFKSLQKSTLSNLVRVAGTSEKCLNAAKDVFSYRLGSQQVEITADNQDELDIQLDILKYFGGLIKSFSFNFAWADDYEWDRNQTTKYRRLLQYANKYHDLVDKFKIGGKLCELSLFNEIQMPFKRAETVKICQENLMVAHENLCDLFPSVRRLELDFDTLSDRKTIDCEFDLMDELIIGGKLLDKPFDETFKNLLAKNTRIKRITLKSPSSHRTFQLIKKYLKNLEEVRIFHIVHENDDDDDDDEDDTQEEILIPSVRKLEINLPPDTKCQLPMSVVFGGEDLQELELTCDEADRNYKYFSTLYRYPNVKSLTVGVQIDDRALMKMVGKFPLLTKVNISLPTRIEIETIGKFIEECSYLNEMTFELYTSGSIASVDDLKANIDDKFTIINDLENYRLRLERSGSSVPAGKVWCNNLI